MLRLAAGDSATSRTTNPATRRLRRQNSMQRLGYGRLIAGLAALAVVIGVSWVVVEYLVPSPPSSVTIATGRKGTTFDYFGERYRAHFARAGIELKVRSTAGALENFRLLRDLRRKDCVHHRRYLQQERGARTAFDGTCL